MTQETFVLKWKFLMENTSAILEEETTKKNSFADVTLVSDELTKFKVHKFVLSACSPIFKEILLNNPHENPIIYLNGVKEDEVQTMLQLIYYGQVNIYTKRLEILFKAIEKFQLTGIDIPTFKSELSKSKEQKKKRRPTQKYVETQKENVLKQ